MENLIFFAILGFLLWRSFKHYPSSGDYNLLRGIENFLWLVGTVVFILVWGGIFWW